MSKNLYRINKKSDLDEIMKKNFLKPISIIFVSKSIDKKLYDDIATTLKDLSKQLTYSMVLIVDFDDFVDNLNFFSQIKENLPQMITYFKAKQLAKCDEKESFIPIMVSTMDKIHSSYVGKLMDAFNQSVNQTNQNQQQNTNSNEHMGEQSSNNQLNNSNSSPHTTLPNNPNNPEKLQNLKNSENKKQEKQEKQEEQDEQNEQEEEQEEEQEVEQEELESEKEDESEQEESKKQQTKSKKQNEASKPWSNDNKIKKMEIGENNDDNTTEEIRLKKEKLKEIKRLKEMLNRGT